MAQNRTEAEPGGGSLEVRDAPLTLLQGWAPGPAFWTRVSQRHRYRPGQQGGAEPSQLSGGWRRALARGRGGGGGDGPQTANRPVPAAQRQRLGATGRTPAGRRQASGGRGAPLPGSALGLPAASRRGAPAPQPVGLWAPSRCGGARWRFPKCGPEFVPLSSLGPRSDLGERLKELSGPTRHRPCPCH